MNRKTVFIVLVLFSLISTSCASGAEKPYPIAVKPGVSVLAIQKFARSEILTTSANGLEMSAANFRVEDNVLKVDVCYQKPNNENWLVFDTAIQVGETKVSVNGASGLEETSSMEDGRRQIYTFANRADELPGQIQYVEYDGLPDYRCDTLDFRIGSSLDLSHFELVIKTLMLDRHDGEECTKYRDTVQGILDAKGLGIRMDCVMQEYGSFQTIAEKPDSMSQEEAEQLVSDAFREAFMINGPWVFTVTIEQ